MGVCCEQGQGGEGGRTDGESLAHGGGGVSDGVELVSDLAYFLGKMAHLGDAAGVVGNGTVGVNAQGHSGDGKHAHGGAGDAVQAAEIVADEGGGADENHRDHRGFHADGHSGENDRGRAGLGGFGDVLDRRVVAGGVDFSNETDEHAHTHTGENGQEEAEFPEHGEGDEESAGNHDAAGDEGSHTEGGSGVSAVLHLHESGSGNGGKNAHAAQNEGINDTFRSEGRKADGHGGDDGVHVGLEQVGTHAGNVAHVVAHVVGDDCGVSGVVLGDAGFNLPHQVGSDVGSLRVDAAAHAGEEGDGAGPHAEAGDEGRIFKESVAEKDAQDTDADYGHAHDAAAFESHGEGVVHAPGGGEGRLAVGLGGDHHARVSGRCAAESPDDEGKAGRSADLDPEEHADDDKEGKKPFIFPVQESHGPPVNDVRKLRNPFVFNPEHIDAHIGYESERKCGDSGDADDQQQ